MPQSLGQGGLLGPLRGGLLSGMRLYKESGMDVRGDALIELPNGTI
jgi:hypothetical protein